MILYVFLFRDCKYEGIHRLVDQSLFNTKRFPVQRILSSPYSLGGEDGLIEIDDAIVLALQFSK